MNDTVACPECGRYLKLGEEHAGRALQCPLCGAAVMQADTEPEIELRVGEELLRLDSDQQPAVEVPSEPSPAFVCPSCGAKTPIPADHQSLMMTCPECGKRAEIAQPQAAAPARVSEKVGQLLFTCERCQAQLPIPDSYLGKILTCPDCDAMAEVTSRNAIPLADAAAVKRTEIQSPALPVRLVAPPPSPSADGHVPGPERQGTYDLTVQGDPCPGCQRCLPRGTFVCLECGYNKATGERELRTCERRELSWQCGFLDFAVPLWVFVFFEFLFALLLFRDIVVGLTALSTGGVLLLLAWGTSLKVHLVRQSNGKVKLTRTRTLGFIPCGRKLVDLKRYHILYFHCNVGSDRPRDTLLYESFLFRMFLPFRFALAVYRFLVYGAKSTSLELSDTTGRETLIVYRGRKDADARPILEGILEVADLELRRK